MNQKWLVNNSSWCPSKKSKCLNWAVFHFLLTTTGLPLIRTVVSEVSCCANKIQFVIFIMSLFFLWFKSLHSLVVRSIKSKKVHKVWCCRLWSIFFRNWMRLKMLSPFGQGNVTAVWSWPHSLEVLCFVFGKLYLMQRLLFISDRTERSAIYDTVLHNVSSVEYFSLGNWILCIQKIAYCSLTIHTIVYVE